MRPKKPASNLYHSSGIDSLSNYSVPLVSIKLDSLYKPILRRFRSYFRSVFDLSHNPKTYQHWSNDSFLIKVREHCTYYLKLPEELLDEESIIKILTILFPCSIRKNFGSSNLLQTKQLFIKVFKENNVKIRNTFFSDPLVKYLWSKIFIVDSPDICISHLRRIRSHALHGEAKYDRLIKDMAQNENIYNFKLLPDEAREQKNNKIFSQHEEYADLLQNGKYNKKQAKTVRQNIKSYQANMNKRFEPEKS